jgi:steroid delta-isomerase-like uncharacterized protein
MSVAANHDLGRRFFESQDRSKQGPDPALCTEGYVAHIGGNPPMTLADHHAFGEMFYAAFPDLKHVIEDTVADDGRVAVRFTLRGTHQGDLMGVPPTGRPIDTGGIAILRIQDGRVAEVNGQFDQFGMMRQLGVIQ